MYQKVFKWFRAVAFLEGVSYLLIAATMILKYQFDMPRPNQIVGMIHGVLFILYCLDLAYLGMKGKWKFRDLILSFIASLLPFGTFIADKKIFSKYENIEV